MNCPKCNYTNLILNKRCDQCGYPLTEEVKEKGQLYKMEMLQKIIESGTEIADYTFGDLIGVGGFGQVYKGRSKALKRDVAIKVYSIKNDQLLYAFHRGANMLSQLNHPNIVTIYDYFVETNLNLAIIVMELLNPNETLRKYVGTLNSQAKMKTVVQWFEEMVSTLRFCHQKRYETLKGSKRIGIYHGDIKPDNLFIHLDRIKVGDFMIPDLEQVIKLLEQGYTFDPQGTIAFGTPNYMSKEQEMDGVINEQTDIYNLGITMYELMTGFYPYGSENPKGEKPKKMRLYNPYVPEWFDKIILKCIENNPENRYQKITEVEIDLMNFFEAQGKIVASNLDESTYLMIRSELKLLQEKEIPQKVKKELKVMQKIIEIEENAPMKTLFCVAKILETTLQTKYRRSHFNFKDLIEHAHHNNDIGFAEYHLLTGLRSLRNLEGHTLAPDVEKNIAVSAILAGLVIINRLLG